MWWANVVHTISGASLDNFATLEQQSRVVIESTASWYWLCDLLEGNGFDVVISNPVKTKAIALAKIKNDRVDSHMLAQRNRLTSPSFIPLRG